MTTPSSFDARQSQMRTLLDQVNSAAVTQLDSTMESVNSELTAPGRLIAQSTPSLVVSVGSGSIINPNTSKNRVLPFLNNAPVSFAGGTITFPSTSGTITVSPGTNASISIGASQYVAVLVQLTSTGQLALMVGSPAASLGTVVVPNSSASNLALGYIVVQSNGSSVIQNITNAMLYQFTGGGGSGGGSGTGSKNYLSVYTASLSSNTPNVGNGNFDGGNTSGWTLAHSTLSSFVPTSTASAGTPFDSAHGGTAATALAFNALPTFSLATTGNLSNSSNQITSLASTTGLQVGMSISSAVSGFPSPATIINIIGSTVYMSQNFTGTTTSGASITFSSQALAGSYSGSLSTFSTTSVASTPGDMLISEAFYIDEEDQAKVMTIKFYYQNNGLVSAVNFSGTNANTFAIWVYDVTNALWIQPAGVYNLVQVNGPGYATATFQTSSNSTQYQLALININASTSAYDLFIDDIFLGPQTAPIGYAGDDWVLNSDFSYTGMGTVNNSVVYTRRVGDSLQVRGYFTAGAPTATTATIVLPYKIDATKVTVVNAIFKFGDWIQTTAAVNPIPADNIFGALFYIESDQSSVYFAYEVGGNTFREANGNDFVSTSDSISFEFSYPVAGWGSNTSMSSDTDTRVVAAKAASVFNPSVTSLSIIPTSTLIYDTHGTMNTPSSGQYTAPVSGFYTIISTIESGTAVFNIYVYKNNSPVALLATAANSTEYYTSSVDIQLEAGDFVDIRVDVTTTLGNQGLIWSVSRKSGPAVVLADETVAMHAGLTNNYATGGTFQVIKFDTVTIDTHNGYSTSTGLYTVPVSGIYAITCAGILTVGASGGSTYVEQSGVQKDYLVSLFTAKIDSGSTMLKCLAGDTLGIYIDNSVTVTGQPVFESHVSISRIK